MDTPNPEQVGWLAKYGAIAAAFIGGTFSTAVAIYKSVGSRMRTIETKVDAKANKTDVDLAIEHFNTEHRTTRDTIGKIFDQIRDNEHRSQDRYEKLLDAINQPKGIRR